MPERRADINSVEAPKTKASVVEGEVIGLHPGAGIGQKPNPRTLRPNMAG